MGLWVRFVNLRHYTILSISILICITIVGVGMASGQGEPMPTETEDEYLPTVNCERTLTKTTKAAKTEFSLTSGIRSDDLEWSIAGNGIDVLSELAWTDVNSFQVSIENRTQFNNQAYFKGHFNYAEILDGKVRDSDFGRDGRINEWSRSVSDSDGDQNWDFSAGGGYTFSFLSQRLDISPMLGVSYHKQNLRIQKGTQVVSETNPFSGSRPPSPGPLPRELNSSYFARWVGPWLGVDLRYKPKMKTPVYHAMELRLSLAAHWADYYGEGNWNLRSDLEHPKSFEHEADGIGISMTGQCLVQLADQWHLNFSVSHQDWSTGTGTDRKFLSSGGTTTTQLNEVSWTSFSFMMGAAYRF